MAKKINIPEFVEIFAEVRGNPAKHLMKKDDGTGEYLVPDSEIDKLAEAILASEFYMEPWLHGCEPATVLFEGVITELRSENSRRRRKAVNAAFQAEHRVVAMGMESYVEWRRAGMPATTTKAEVTKKEKPVRENADRRPPKPSVPLPALKPATAERLRQIAAKESLVEEMPHELREQLSRAMGGLQKGHLLQPTAVTLLLAVEQWLRLRKQKRDHASNKEALGTLITSALQQYDYLLNTFAGDEQVVGHLDNLRTALASADAKQLASVIRAGDRLCGLLDGTIAPVVSIARPQDLSNIADANYVRAKLGHWMPSERGRPVAGAGKGQKEKARRKSG